MKQHCLSRNEGGVCDNCGMPAFTHDGNTGECADDGALVRMQQRIDRWLSIVSPAQDAYQEARRIAKNMRRQYRREAVNASDTEAAERRRDELLIEYRAAIRRADREA